MVLGPARRLALLLAALLAATVMSVVTSPPSAQAASTDVTDCRIRNDIGKERFCAIDRANEGSRIRGFFSWFYKDEGPKEFTGKIDFSFYKVDNTPCKWAKLESHDYATGQTYPVWYSSCKQQSYSVSLGGDEARTPRNGYFKFSVCGKKSSSTCRTAWIQKTAQRAPR